eukprot:TRINITY_DN14993_c0_g1_i1.p1 TRINITY_DN14993_c0_g1~~TRINITY_DN14993_c0_g1_i1.p1  ORF type:complete len:593 (+),score=103.02 TRINITY_DN14993_c0_g1_i1:20-1798(+)
MPISFTLFVLILTTILLGGVEAQKQPNLVIIIVDDLGYADVSYNGGEIPTPTLDSLSASGIRLSSYYTHPVCTPSRTALMTGRYSHAYGMTGALLGASTESFPPNTTTIASALKEEGYRTHLVGKWHLGHAKWSQTPLERGFDSFFGLYQAAFGHYTKRVAGSLDLRRGREPVLDQHTHATTLFTHEARKIVRDHAQDHSPSNTPLFLILSLTAAHTPLEPAPEHRGPCSHIIHKDRRDYCALVVGIDQSVANLTEELKNQGLWENTILLFTTDNGGQPWAGANNYPLRGAKTTVYEGGCRGVGFLVEGTPKKNLGPGGRYYNGIAHISDWLPTFHSLVGGDPARFADNKIDGQDISRAIAEDDEKIGRQDVFLNMDSVLNQYGYRRGNYKLLLGNAGDNQLYPAPTGKWLVGPESNTYHLDMITETMIWLVDVTIGTDDCISALWREIFREIRYRIARFVQNAGDVQLFDLSKDLSESNNLADELPDLVAELRDRIEQEKKKSPPTMNWMEGDMRGFTSYEEVDGHRFAAPWLEEDEVVDKENLVNIPGLMVKRGLVVLLFIYFFIVTGLVALYLLLVKCGRPPAIKPKTE